MMNDARKQERTIALSRALTLVSTHLDEKYIKWREKAKTDEVNRSVIASIDKLHSTVVTYIYSMLGEDIADVFEEILKRGEKDGK